MVSVRDEYNLWTHIEYLCAERQTYAVESYKSFGSSSFSLRKYKIFIIYLIGKHYDSTYKMGALEKF